MSTNQGTQHISEISYRHLISDIFPEVEYSQFREYCASSNILFVDELQPYDYVAFRTQSKTDAEFVRKIRARAETALSGKAIITLPLGNSKSVTDVEPSKPVNEYHNAPWESSLKAAAEAYMNSPLDGVAIPNRIRHRLAKGGITTIGKMLLTTPEQFLSLCAIGGYSLGVIKSISEDFVRNYIIQTSGIQNASPISGFVEEISKKHISSEHTVVNSESQGVNYLQPAHEYDEAMRVSALFVAANDCMDLPLDVLKLSRRAIHRLYYGGVESVGKVLLATDEQLLNIGQLGPTALYEIREASRVFIQNYINQNPNWQSKIDSLPPEIWQQANHASTNTIVNFSMECRHYLGTILSGNPQSGYEFMLSAEECKIIKRVQQAIEIVGIDLCKLAYNDPASTEAVIGGFQSFIDVQKPAQIIQKLISAIPEARCLKKLSPYIKLFNELQQLKTDNLFNYFSTCNTVNDIKNNIDFIAEQENQHLVKVFIEWLASFDIFDFVKPILAEILSRGRKETSGRKEQIILRRAAGETLEAVSATYDVTRERIRQIEGQVVQAYRNCSLSHSLLLAISAELNGETIITSDDIRNIIPDSELLLYLVKKQPDSQFEYDEYIDCFYLPSLVDPDMVYDLVSGFPKFIHESEREALLDQSTNIPQKYLELAFNRHYRKTGTIWHVGKKLSRALMYSFTMERYFPNGLRLYDADEISRFKKYVRDFFGDIGYSENDRALWGIIQRVSILYDRGMYIHPSRISIPDDLVRRIEKYFLQRRRTSMAYHELYEKFAEELLLRANITNRYALQGVLKDRLGEKYIFYRDGISTIEGYKITQEIETYIRRNSPVTKETLMAAFSGITEAMLMQNIARLPSVILIDNSTFIHAKGLKLTADDYKIQKLIRSLTVDHPITASKLMEILYTKHSDFLFRNNVDSPSTLFGILQFMFSDEFSFSRPYIGSPDTNGISKRDIIVSLLEGQEHVDISYVKSLCEEHHLFFQSPTLMVRALQDDYLRVDEDTLISIECVHATDAKLDEIRKLLSDAISYKGYLVFQSIDNYIFYPDLGVPWTPFFLRSMIEKYFPADFNIIDNPTSQDIAFDLIVNSQLGIDNYEDLIRSAIRDEHRRDPFKDQTSVVKWLIDEGLLTRKAAIIQDDLELIHSPLIRLVDRYLPEPIKDGSFMHTDEYGKLIIR